MNSLNRKKGLFWENWTGIEWAYFIIGIIIAIAFYAIMNVFFGIPKEWAIAIFLIPVAIGGHFYIKKNSKKE